MQYSPFRAAVAAAACALLATATARGQAGVCGDWTIVPTPNPAALNNGMPGIASLGAGELLALGGGSGGTFFTRWDGTGWSDVPLPDVSDVGGAFSVSGLGPAGDGGVWAVGIVVVGGTGLPLAARYDGAEWNVVQAVELEPELVYPFAPRNGHAVDVDAVNANDAWAVGNASGNRGPLTMHWDGSQWTEVLAPAVGTRQNNLYGVAAVAANDAWAVGEFNHGNQAPFWALLLHWDGSAWSQFPNPASEIDGTHLRDVFALAPDDVWAVGYEYNDALFMHYDGASWTIVPSPVSVTTFVNRVEGIATDDVWASASIHGDPNSDPGYFHWDGASWTSIPGPLVPGAANVNRGGGLVALGPCEAWAVGGWDDGSQNFTLAERLQILDRPTDTNGDGIVDALDYLALIAQWGDCPGCSADFNGDDVVDALDMLTLLGDWG